ncbi:MAG: SRPBCC family protein [Methylotenera sp.]
MSELIKFNIKQHTQAPLRLAYEMDFNASPEALFQTISDHNAVLNWVPLMKSVSMEHQQNNTQACDVGSVRHCSLHAMGGIDETILWWNPPYGYAFKVEAKSKIMMPTVDHVSVMQIDQLAEGGSHLTWQHYYNWRGLLMRHITAIMFPKMMETALNNIRKVLHEAPEQTCATTGCQKTCPK